MIGRRFAVVALLTATVAAALTGFAPASATSTQPIWVFGDSIAAGTWLQPGESWPSRLDAAIGGGQVRNLAVGGQAVAFGTNRMDDLVKSTLTATPAADRPSIILFAGGTNDLIQSANDMYVTRSAIFNLNAWINTNAPTVKFYVLSITPLRSDAGYADALSLRRASLNDWERTQWTPYGQLLDVGDVLTAGPTYGNPRWYENPLHPNAAGAQLTADAVYTLLEQKGSI